MGIRGAVAEYRKLPGRLWGRIYCSVAGLVTGNVRRGEPVVSEEKEGTLGDEVRWEAKADTPLSETGVPGPAWYRLG